MAPALWNGFPLIFTDSLSYLTSGVELVAPVDRPIFYGLFIRLSNLILDLWGLIFLQSALVIFLLLNLAGSIFPNLSRRVTLLWICIVGLTTSVPWFVSQISADIFTSCLFMTMIILALNCERNSFRNIIFLGGLLILEVCMHSGNLMIGFMLLGGIVLLLWLQKKSWSYIKKFSVITLTSFVICFTSIIASNALFEQGITFNRWGKVIFLARVLEDGPGLRYLNSACETKDLKTCAALPIFNEAAQKELDLGLIDAPELKNLVLNALLWDGGINEVGGLSALNGEATSIILGAIRAYPLEMASVFLNNSIDQLMIFSVGNQFGSTAHLVAINDFFQTQFPGSFQNYKNSKQFSGRMIEATKLANLIYNTVIIFSSFFILAITYLSLIRQPRMTALCSVSSMQLLIFGVFGFLISNAMITGGISAVFDRYQSRVIWLLPAISLLFFIGLMAGQLKKSPNFFPKT